MKLRNVSEVIVVISETSLLRIIDTIVSEVIVVISETYLLRIIDTIAFDTILGIT